MFCQVKRYPYTACEFTVNMPSGTKRHRISYRNIQVKKSQLFEEGVVGPPRHPAQIPLYQR